MKKKITTLVLCAMLLALGFSAGAQQPGKIPRVGVLSPGFPGPSPLLDAFRQGLRELGYVEGQNIVLEYRFAEAKPEPLPDLAAELVRLKVDVILTINTPASQAAFARLAARQLGLNPDKDVVIAGVGGQGERWAALTGGHIQATVVQPPFTLLARKAGYPVLIDFSKQDFEYTIAGPLTTRSFIRSDRETVMNFMRGLADGMDFYRDEKNKDKVIKFLGDYYRSSAVEELEETRRVYSQLTPGLPIISAKAIENVIANDKSLSGMNLNAAELLDLSFLERLREERKAKSR